MRALTIDECMLVAGGGDPPPSQDETITVTAPPRQQPSEVIVVEPGGLAWGSATDSIGQTYTFTGVGFNPTPFPIVSLSNDDHDEERPTVSWEVGFPPGVVIGVWEPDDFDPIQDYIDRGMPGNIP